MADPRERLKRLDDFMMEETMAETADDMLNEAALKLRELAKDETKSAAELRAGIAEILKPFDPIELAKLGIV